MANYFIIGQKNGEDYNVSSFVAKNGLKVEYEMLSADTSGRTADGHMHIDLIGTDWWHKVTVTFIPCTPDKVSEILQQINSYIYTANGPSVPIKFYDPRTGGVTSDWVNTYPGTPSITWNTLANGLQQTSTFSISFIEL